MPPHAAHLVKRHLAQRVEGAHTRIWHGGCSLVLRLGVFILSVGLEERPQVHPGRGLPRDKLDNLPVVAHGLGQLACSARDDRWPLPPVRRGIREVGQVGETTQCSHAHAVPHRRHHIDATAVSPLAWY